MENLKFKKETGEKILPLDSTNLHIIEGEWGKELILPSDKATSFILLSIV